MNAADANAILRSGDDRAIHQLLRKAPADIDPTLAAQKLAGWLDGDRSVWGFARYYKKLPVPVIRALLALLESRTGPAEVFLRVYVAGASDLAEAWERAMYRLLSLDTTYAWGSKQKRAKLTGLAKEPRVVEALQAAVVANPEVRLDALAVLALDASEASVDALMPHFERAAKDQGRGLDRLSDLRKYAANTPAMTAMLTRVDALLDQRNAASPALALAEHIGLGPQKVFWFDGWLASLSLNGNGVPGFQGAVSVDSRSPDWFSCSLSDVTAAGRRDRMTQFSAQKVYVDTLGLGRCTAEEIPAWLARAAKKLNVKFAPIDPRSNVRGKKRNRIAEWLNVPGS